MIIYKAIVMFCLFSLRNAINKPAYKIVLTQRGYAQALQYDLETPPIREFTFCTWIKLNDLTRDQTIFTYMASSNNRAVRLWLDSGGHYLKASIEGTVTSSTLVDIATNVWRHICLSYQSNFGAWALYLDTNMIHCESDQRLYGFVLPKEGSFIIGYGTAANGESNGLEGEIYGAMIILASTIEKNYTVKKDPIFEQKWFHKNKLKTERESNNNKYIVLNNLLKDDIENIKPQNSNMNNNDFGTSPSSLITISDLKRNATEIPRFHQSTLKSNTVNIWELIQNAGQEPTINPRRNKFKAQGFASTSEVPVISEFETPPSPSDINDHFNFNAETSTTFANNFQMKTNKAEQITKLHPLTTSTEMFEYEKPPPPGANSKVFGQWSGSKFAGNVLNYLKSINFNPSETKRIPSTITFHKISDSFPYPSDFKSAKVKLMPIQKSNFMKNYMKIRKRDIREPVINVEIITENPREEILRTHAETRPKTVEIINKGEYSTNSDLRYYRNVDTTLNEEPSHNLQFSSLYSNDTTDNLVSILPFLKSAEYFIDGSEILDKNSKNEMYIRSLSNANKWHNIHTYSNDYTLRKLNKDNFGTASIEQKIEEANNKQISIPLKWKYETKKLEKPEDTHISKGRELASVVSDQSKNDANDISVFKYNHGYLPQHGKKLTSQNDNAAFESSKNSFEKQIKLGNALNERNVIGKYDEERKQSFVGGNEKIPDIQRYRSIIDKVNWNVPPSLGTKICIKGDENEKTLFVQPDGRIDSLNKWSPVRDKNQGVDFMQQNYKKCSLHDSTFKKSPLLLIDWSTTPVRLFGGAFAQKTTDLCGFF